MGLHWILFFKPDLSDYEYFKFFNMNIEKPRKMSILNTSFFQIYFILNTAFFHKHEVLSWYILIASSWNLIFNDSKTWFCSLLWMIASWNWQTNTLRVYYGNNGKIITARLMIFLNSEYRTLGKFILLREIYLVDNFAFKVSVKIIWTKFDFSLVCMISDWNWDEYLRSI